MMTSDKSDYDVEFIFQCQNLIIKKKNEIIKKLKEINEQKEL